MVIVGEQPRVHETSYPEEWGDDGAEDATWKRRRGQNDNYVTIFITQFGKRCVVFILSNASFKGGKSHTSL